MNYFFSRMGKGIKDQKKAVKMKKGFEAKTYCPIAKNRGYRIKKCSKDNCPLWDECDKIGQQKLGEGE